MSDSRCPVDVNCIWAGEIRVALVAESTAGKKEMELWDRAPDAIVEGVNVKLIGASPAPNSKVHLLPSDYRIQFRATSASGTTAPATSRE
ncbi:MAG: hypothetical protein ABI639_13285 [Thermoanaerobaculia bacterium]